MLRIAFESMPGRLDPRFATDAFAARIGGLVFVSLVRVGSTGEIRPYLAREWRWEDALTCVFDLDPAYAFSDGRRVAAGDVAATYASILAPESGSPRRAQLEGVESVTAEGGARVRVRLRAPNAAFLEGATVGILASQQVARGNVADVDLLASGPYRLASFDRSRGIDLEANSAFAARPVPIARISIRIVPDSLTRVLELRSGAIDLVQSAIDPDTVEWLETHEPELRVTRSPSANLQYLGMNVRHPALADPRVRRALAWAMDRRALVEHLMVGQASVAYSFLPPEHWAHTPRVRRYERRPDRARQLLDAAGWPDPDGGGPRPRLTLSYKTTTDDLARRVAEAIAEQLASVGIALDIRSYDWGTFFADIKSGQFHLYSLQWVGIGDPDILRHVLHSTMTPPAGVNRGGYRDRRTDRLTEAARGEIDVDQRRSLYAQVERRSARLLPLVPLWWPQRIVVSNRRLDGFAPHPAGDLTGVLDARLHPRGDVLTTTPGEGHASTAHGTVEAVATRSLMVRSASTSSRATAAR